MHRSTSFTALTPDRIGQVKKALADWLDGCQGDEVEDLLAICARANDIPHLVAASMKVEKWLAANGNNVEDDTARSSWKNECVRVIAHSRLSAVISLKLMAQVAVPPGERSQPSRGADKQLPAGPRSGIPPPTCILTPTLLALHG